MKFGPVPVAEAEGAILAHSVPLAAGRLRKGLTIDAAAMDALRNAGQTEVVVARLEPGDVHENDAAVQLAGAILGGADPGLRATPGATGRVNLHATQAGLIGLDASRIVALNALNPMITLATVAPWHWAEVGDMIATIKIISYAVPSDALARAVMLAPGAIRVHPRRAASALLIQTVVGGDDGATGHRAIKERLERKGMTMRKIVVPHREQAIAAALETAAEDIVLILTASATSDIGDTAPAALGLAGGTVTRFGMPVDPGNLLFLGALHGTPVIGLPGCARSPALNGADWVLERVICGVPVTSGDIAAMGVGGLLKEIPTRPHPREKR